jgi:UDP-N-acetylglucosamine 1-carboxyvinyltransferase
MKSITSSSSDFLVIRGGRKLRGRVKVSGSKNASLPILIASLLTEEPCIVKRVPNLLDVKTTFELLNTLGALVHFEEGKAFVHAQAH